jgi:hypothetical protein
MALLDLLCEIFPSKHVVPVEMMILVVPLAPEKSLPVVLGPHLAPSAASSPDADLPSPCGGDASVLPLGERFVSFLPCSSCCS